MKARFSLSQLDHAVKAWTEENQRWILRRRLDKKGWEMVRLDDPRFISDATMKVTQLGCDSVSAEAVFNTERGRACAKAALAAVLAAQQRHR